MVDSWFASESTSSKPAASFAMAAVSGDVGSLVEKRQVGGGSYTDSPIEEPAACDWEMSMATGEFEPSASHALPAVQAPADTTSRPARANAYNSRQHNINRELCALADEGMVELWFGERGIAGEHCISAIRSSTWGDVIERLNRSINSKNNKVGTPSENLTQCLRDCGVVPRKVEGRSKKNWRKPVEGMWEFSEEAWRERQGRLCDQYAGIKRKRTQEEEQPAGASKTRGARPASSSSSSGDAAEGAEALGEEAQLCHSPPSPPPSPLPLLLHPDAHCRL
eukprot:3537198-Rhodomonas_salina.1